MSRIAVLDSGRIAVTNSITGYIELWGAFSGEKIGRLVGHPNVDDDTPEVYAIAALPDGRLASGDEDGSIRLWNVARRQEVGRLRGHTKDVTSLTVLPDGRLLSGSFDSTIRVWDAQSEKEIACLEKVHVGSVDKMLPLPGNRLLSIDFDIGVALWWDLASYTFLQTTDSYAGSINDVQVTPDGRLLYAALDNNIHVRAALGRHRSAVLKGHTKSVASVCWLGADRIASGSFDNTVRIWRLSDAAEITCHRLDFRPSEIAVHASGRLAVADRKSHLALIDV